MHIKESQDPESIAREIKRQHYNAKRPHSSIGYHPPAPEVIKTQNNLTIAMARLT